MESSLRLASHYKSKSQLRRAIVEQLHNCKFKWPRVFECKPGKVKSTLIWKLAGELVGRGKVIIPGPSRVTYLVRLHLLIC